MRTRTIIGKRIVAIRQSVTGRGHGYRPANSVAAIVLEDGTELRPLVLEGDADYYVDFAIAKPPKRK